MGQWGQLHQWGLLGQSHLSGLLGQSHLSGLLGQLGLAGQCFRRDPVGLRGLRVHRVRLHHDHQLRPYHLRGQYIRDPQGFHHDHQARDDRRVPVHRLRREGRAEDLIPSQIPSR